MGKPADFYGILGVSATADALAIHAAHRKLARIHHPDVGGSSQRMAALNQAWYVLRDPGRRAAYDALRAAVLARAVAAAAATPAGPMDPRATAASPAHSTPAPPVAAPPTSASMASTQPPGGPTVLSFGRYSGWSLAQLAVRDPDYLEWLARTPIGRGLEREIRALLLRRDHPVVPTRSGLRAALSGR